MSWDRCGRSIQECSSSFASFDCVVENYEKFDPDSDSAILKASTSIVSCISRIGDKPLFIGSGTIIECDNQNDSFIGTILTSATLLRGLSSAASVPSNLKIDVYTSDGKLYEGQVLGYDFHYNIAIITIKSRTPWAIATAGYLNDATMRPGELVVALGRECLDPHEIMAAPGVLSSHDCLLDCKELILMSCTVTKLAIGGPLVDYNGDIIGINFFCCPFAAFLPIQIAVKCLDVLKKHGRVPRPWLGVTVANLYTSNLDVLDILNQKFPFVLKGVIVEKVIGHKKRRSLLGRTKVVRRIFWSERKRLLATVWRERIKKERLKKKIDLMIMKKSGIKPRVRKMKAQDSPASRAGLCVGDVIINCDENIVGSHMEFFEAFWNKEGSYVKLNVIRPSVGEQWSVTIKVGTSPKTNRWPLPEGGMDVELVRRLAIDRDEKVKLEIQ